MHRCRQQAAGRAGRNDRQAPHLHAQERADGEQPLAQAPLGHAHLRGRGRGGRCRRTGGEQADLAWHWQKGQRAARPAPATQPTPAALTLRRHSSSGGRSGMLAGRRTASSSRCPSSTSITAGEGWERTRESQRAGQGDSSPASAASLGPAVPAAPAPAPHLR
jgi:hypothetical protein